MRLLLLAMLLVSAPLAANTPYLVGDELQAEISKNCADGCVTFNREEAAQLEASIQLMLQRTAKQAFEAGKADQKASCASLI